MGLKRGKRGLNISIHSVMDFIFSCSQTKHRFIANSHWAVLIVHQIYFFSGTFQSMLRVTSARCSCKGLWHKPYPTANARGGPAWPRGREGKLGATHLSQKKVPPVKFLLIQSIWQNCPQTLPARSSSESPRSPALPELPGSPGTLRWPLSPPASPSRDSSAI